MYYIIFGFLCYVGSLSVYASNNLLHDIETAIEPQKDDPSTEEPSEKKPKAKKKNNNNNKNKNKKKKKKKNKKHGARKKHKENS